MEGTIGSAPLDFRIDPPPRRRRLRPRRIAGAQQHLQLMGLEIFRSLHTIRPETESPLREPFLAQPKPLTVILC